MRSVLIIVVCLFLAGCTKQVVTRDNIPDIVSTGSIQPVITEEPCTFTASGVSSQYIQVYEAGVDDEVVASKRYEVDTDSDTANEIDDTGAVISRGKPLLRDFYKDLPKPKTGIIKDGKQYYTVTGSALRVADFDYDSLDTYTINYICSLSGAIEEISARQYYYIGQKRYFVGVRLLFGGI